MSPLPRKSFTIRQQRPAVAPRPLARFSPDLSFPVSYREQQKYLELADHFLGLSQPRHSNVISIDQAPRRKSRGLPRKAA